MNEGDVGELPVASPVDQPNRPGESLKESRDHFSAGDYIVSPTAVRVDDDGDWNAAYKRGVLGSIQKVMYDHQENPAAGSPIIQEIAEKAIGFGIFDRDELREKLKEMGVGVTKKK